MKRVHLLGHPVSQSLSPVMQNAAFRALELDWEYSVLDVTPADLVATLERLEADPDVAGCNVTVPHKIAVFEWLTKDGRTVREGALRAGAVNTLFRDPEGRFEGTSTDFQGAMNAILARIEAERPDFPWAFAEVAIIGTGGAAQTLAVGFAAMDAKPLRSISIHGRNLEKAQAIADLATPHAVSGRTLSVHPLSEWEPVSHPRIVCQTTTVGMDSGEAAGQSPVPEGSVEGPDIAFDLVYKPQQTPFLAQAEAHGALVVPGIGMLVGQGAKACEHWLEASAPKDLHRPYYADLCVVMENALREKSLL